MKRIKDIGEFGLIREIQMQLRAPHPSVVAGIGDDCAVLRNVDPEKYLLFTCDPVVEGVHYRAGTPMRRVGWKAMARNLSDIAAMGGLPRWAVVSLGLRPDATVREVRQLYAGMKAVADQFGCAIVGGDTTHVKREQFVVVAMIGEVEKSHLALRSGARVGDSVFVTGRLGGSLRGKHLTFRPRIDEGRWLTAHFSIHGMIDLSDGLSSDLHRLVEAGREKIGFEIFTAEIPIASAGRGSVLSALNDGEDFELLFTIDPRDVTALRTKWARRFRLELTEIGRVIRARGGVWQIDRQGHRRVLQPGGYNHFRR